MVEMLASKVVVDVACACATELIMCAVCRPIIRGTVGAAKKLARGTGRLGVKAICKTGSLGIATVRKTGSLGVAAACTTGSLGAAVIRAGKAKTLGIRSKTEKTAKEEDAEEEKEEE
jgi:hypothetical protein